MSNSPMNSLKKCPAVKFYLLISKRQGETAVSLFRGGGKEEPPEKGQKFSSTGRFQKLGKDVSGTCVSSSPARSWAAWTAATWGMLEFCNRKTAPAVHPWVWCRTGTTSKDRAKPVGYSESGGKRQEVRGRAGWGTIPLSLQRNTWFKFIMDQKTLPCLPALLVTEL